jgi:uncharacterized protein YjgD (DUF1641 family)
MMAVPIRVKIETPESSEEIAAQLEEARVQHAKAVLAGYELLQELHDAKVLDVLRGALAAGDPLAIKLATAMNSADVVNAVRNFISLTKIMGSIDAEFLHRLADEFCYAKPGSQPAPSFWRTIRELMSVDSRRALAGTVAFIHAFGKAMAASPKK